MSTSKMALKRFMSETQDTLKQCIILPVNSAVWYSVGMELVTQRSAKHCHFSKDWMGHSTGQWQVLTMTDGEYFTLLQAFTTAFSHFRDFVKHTLSMPSCEAWVCNPSFHYCIFTLPWFRQAYTVVTELWKWDWESAHGLDGLPDKYTENIFIPQKSLLAASH